MNFSCLWQLEPELSLGLFSVVLSLSGGGPLGYTPVYTVLKKNLQKLQVAINSNLQSAELFNLSRLQKSYVKTSSS